MSAIAKAAAGHKIVPEELERCCEGNSLLSDLGANASEGLVSQLRGVPKGALTTVLGQGLGSQVWEQVRGELGSTRRSVADAEVVAALVGHLARQAAKQLCASERHAKFVRLTVYRADGTCNAARTRLPWLTQDACEIAKAALRVFDSLGVSPEGVRSLSLDVTVTTAKVAEPSSVPAWQTAVAIA